SWFTFPGALAVRGALSDLILERALAAGLLGQSGAPQALLQQLQLAQLERRLLDPLLRLVELCARLPEPQRAHFLLDGARAQPLFDLDEAADVGAGLAQLTPLALRPLARRLRHVQLGRHPALEQAHLFQVAHGELEP